MKIFEALRPDETSTNSKEIFEYVKDEIGILPNLYTAMGVSDKLLAGFLVFTDALKEGEFSTREYEAITLATSQANNCKYWLRAHRFKGDSKGINEKEIIEIKTKNISDTKLRSLVNLVSQIINRMGHPSEKVMNNFFEEGYNKAAFAELFGIIALNTITINIYNNGSFEIEFPEVQKT